MAVSRGGGSYLGGVLHPVHGVLGAVVVGGAPVQVELAQAVGPAERAAPQHCEEKLVSGELAPPSPTDAALRPGGGRREAAPRPHGPLFQKRVLASIKANAVSILSCLFARFIIFFNVNLTFMSIKAKQQGEPWGCRQGECGWASGAVGSDCPPPTPPCALAPGPVPPPWLCDHPSTLCPPPWPCVLRQVAECRWEGANSTSVSAAGRMKGD